MVKTYTELLMIITIFLLTVVNLFERFSAFVNIFFPNLKLPEIKILLLYMNGK
jgi:hypothetical protein